MNDLPPLRFSLNTFWQLGLGFTTNWWVSITTESQNRYAPWPTPHTEVVEVEHKLRVVEVQLSFLFFAVEMIVPLWEVSP